MDTSLLLQLTSSVVMCKAKVTEACGGGLWYLSTICKAESDPNHLPDVLLFGVEVFSQIHRF